MDKYQLTATTGRLIVTAIAEDGRAAPGNALRCDVVVSVTHEDGVPVFGLKASNFRLGTHIKATDGVLGANSRIESIITDTAGVYLLGIVPIDGTPWKAGVYVWSVEVVANPSSRGQALFSTTLN